MKFRTCERLLRKVSRKAGTEITIKYLPGEITGDRIDSRMEDILTGIDERAERGIQLHVLDAVMDLLYDRQMEVICLEAILEDLIRCRKKPRPAMLEERMQDALNAKHGALAPVAYDEERDIMMGHWHKAVDGMARKKDAPSDIEIGAAMVIYREMIAEQLRAAIGIEAQAV